MIQCLWFSIPSFERNVWKWCNDKLTMAPVWFIRTQLPLTVMKRSHKVKVTKKDRSLSDTNFGDGEENITKD